MKPLEDYSLGERIGITLIIALCILFMLAFIGWISGGWEAAGAREADLPPLDLKWEARILELDRAAIELAYHDQVKHIFEVWMKDSTDQPRRAIIGVRNARLAFISSMDAIERRAQRLKNEGGR